MASFGDWGYLISGFNGPDENPISEGGKWSKLDTSAGGVLRSVSGAVTSNTSTTGESYWNVQQFGPNVECWATIAVMPTDNNNMDVSARIQQAGGSATYDGYRVRVLQLTGTDILQLTRVTNGVITNIGSGLSRDFAVGEKFGLRCIGVTIEGWYDDGTGWKLGTSVVDTTYQNAGNVAIHVRGTTGRADDFYAGSQVLRPEPSPQVNVGGGMRW